MDAARVATRSPHRVSAFSAPPQGVRGEMRVKSYTADPQAIGAYGAADRRGAARGLPSSSRCGRSRTT